MMGGLWGDGFDGTTIEDLAVIRTDEAGIYVGADEVDTRNLTIRRLTVERADRGLVFAGSVGIEGTVSDVLLTGSSAGMDGWGSVEVTMGPCDTFGNGEADAGAAAGLARDCLRVAPGYRDLERLAGADGLYFTDDDGWRPTTGPALTAASDGGPLGAR